MRFLSLTAVAIFGLMTAAPPPPDDNELTSALSTLASAPPGGVEAVVSGELRISWRREGPQLSVSGLSNREELERRREVRPHHPFAPEGCHVFTTFRHTTRNRLGGKTAAHTRSAEATLDLEWDADGAGFARARYAREPGGRTRVTTRLHDPDARDNVVYYLDGRAFDTLTFWVRTQEPAQVGLTDAAHDDGGTPLVIGSLDMLTAATEADGWRRVEISLDALPERLDRSLLAELSIEPDADSGTLDLGPMALCRDGAQPAPPSAPAAHAGQPTVDSSSVAGGQALWVWHTREAMSEPERRDELARLIRDEGFDRVYLQLPRGFSSDDLERRDPAHAALRDLIVALTEAGAESHALDGAADFALPENHDDVVESIDAVIQYNAGSEPEARIAGVHLDVEPYLLPGFSGDQRAEIAAGYLTLLDRVGARTGPAGLYFEVAIPFWFDTVLVHRNSESVPDSEVFRPLSEATIDRVDAVALMDYRTRADGSAGTVALAASELDYAVDAGTDIRIGLETTWLPDEETLRFSGPPTPGLPDRESSRPWIVAASTDEGIRFFAVPDEAMSSLVEELRELGIDPDDAFHWRASARIRVPADRLTFHDLGIGPLKTVVAETVAESVRYPSFAGVAIHYDRTYRRLLEKP